MSVPLLKNLELSLAGRYDDYSDFGNTTNPKVAAALGADRDAGVARFVGHRASARLRLRRSASGHRRSRSSSSTRYGCAVNPAVLPVRWTTTSIFSGNPDLDAEKSETFNFGVAYKSEPDTELTVDYWDIEQKNKIDEAPFGFIYNEFCNDQNSTICQRSAPLPGDSLGPLQTISIDASSISASRRPRASTWAGTSRLTSPAAG